MFIAQHFRQVQNVLSAELKSITEAEDSQLKVKR